MTDLYGILGITKTASNSEIHTAFRKVSLTTHPDRGGNSEEFNQVRKAHEILSDVTKRKLYDQQGLKAFDGIGNPVHASFQPNTFFHFFHPEVNSVLNNQPLLLEYSITLEESFHGCEKILETNLFENCIECNGLGGQNLHICTHCHGSGKITIQQALNAFISTQIIQGCSHCNGKGKTIKPDDQCKKCHGKGKIQVKASLKLIIPKGSVHGSMITMVSIIDPKENHLSPPSIKLIIQEHHVWKALGPNGNLKYLPIVFISLVEALLGCTRTIMHLDGNPFVFTLPIGSLQQLENECQINELGMPIKNQDKRGHLLIVFRVQWPTVENLKTLEDKEKELLEQILSFKLRSTN